MSLNREQIEAARGWPTHEFDVPTWGGKLKIRALSAGERLALAAETQELQGDSAFRFFAKLICLSAVDDEGKLIFDIARDYETLLGKDWDTLRLVAEQIMRFNSLAGSDEQELEKN